MGHTLVLLMYRLRPLVPETEYDQIFTLASIVVNAEEVLLRRPAVGYQAGYKKTALLQDGSSQSKHLLTYPLLSLLGLHTSCGFERQVEVSKGLIFTYPLLSLLGLHLVLRSEHGTVSRIRNPTLPCGKIRRLKVRLHVRRKCRI